MKFFAGEPFDPLFKLFGLSHIIPLIIVIVGVILLWQNKDKIREHKNEKHFRYGIALVLLLSDLSIYVWRVGTGTFSIKYALPFHLCTITAYALMIILITKNEKLLKYTWYAGLAGAIMALGNPDFGRFNHLHFRYYEFMIIHAFIIWGLVYMVVVHKFKPTFEALWKSYVVVHIYAIFFIVPFNYLTGGTYLMLVNNKVAILEILGPWPMTAIVLEFLLLILFGLAFAITQIPLMITNRNKK